MISPEAVKNALISLENAREDFTVIFSGKSSKKVNGLYKYETREIIIQNRNFIIEGEKTDDNLLMYTAIHEYAHHIHSCILGGYLPPRSHGPEFWAVFHRLLETAEKKGVYSCGMEDSPRLCKITDEIKEKYITANALLFKEFGALLTEAARECEKIGLRFEDYISRILCIPKDSAKLAIKSFQYDINPTVGVDNMRYIAGIRPSEKRLSAERSFLLGKSPESVIASVKTGAPPPSASAEGPNDFIALQKEKLRLERNIASLKKRLEDIERRLEENAENSAAG
ncbi:MAG: hypothetical protein LBC53_04145 [Spirochaetaceae bacterium]|jgi:hypothetical protein|nr:hypothetical protein [Spirochaetaceae bacterium]